MENPAPRGFMDLQSYLDAGVKKALDRQRLTVATVALHGLLTNPNFRVGMEEREVKDIAPDYAVGALALADALIAAVDKS